MNANWGSLPIPMTFATTSRQAKAPSQVPAESQPALFQLKLQEDIDEAQAFGAPRYKLKYKALIYFRGGTDPQVVNETQINAILDALDAVLQPSPVGTNQTLGGLAVNAWKDGRTEIETGILDQQCWVEVPITVLCLI